MKETQTFTANNPNEPLIFLIYNAAVCFVEKRKRCLQLCCASEETSRRIYLVVEIINFLGKQAIGALLKPPSRSHRFFQ